MTTSEEWNRRKQLRAKVNACRVDLELAQDKLEKAQKKEQEAQHNLEEAIREFENFDRDEL